MGISPWLSGIWLMPVLLQAASAMPLACTDAPRLEVSGLSVLSAPQQDYLAQNLPGCLRRGEEDALSRLLAAAFLQDGYPRIHVAQLSAPPDTLKLAVRPWLLGRVESESGQLDPAAAFPQSATRWLNLFELEQGLAQLNRLSGNQVSMSIYPADEAEGIAAIRLRNDGDGKPLHALLSSELVDDGVQQQASASATLLWDNPLGWMDGLAVSARQTRRGQMQNASYSIPYGYWTFAANYGESRSHQPWVSPHFDTTIDTYASQGGLQLTRTLQRDAIGYAAWRVGLQQQRVDTRFAGSQIAVQSPRISKLSVALDREWQLDGQQLAASLAWQRGLKLGGSSQLPPQAGPFYPTAHFDKYLLSLDHTRHWQAGAYRLALRQSLATQYTPHALYAAEQFSLGGRDSVRGLSRWASSANRGASWQNTLYLDVPGADGMQLRPFVGVDVGRSWSSGPGEESMRMAGVAAGLRMQQQALTLSLDVAKAIQPARARRGAELNLAIHWYM